MQVLIQAGGVLKWDATYNGKSNFCVQHGYANSILNESQVSRGKKKSRFHSVTVYKNFDSDLLTILKQSEPYFNLNDQKSFRGMVKTFDQKGYDWLLERGEDSRAAVKLETWLNHCGSKNALAWGDYIDGTNPYLIITPLDQNFTWEDAMKMF